MSLKIFHLNDSRWIRGGERQLLYLINGLNKLGISNFLGCRRNSEIYKRAQEEGIEVVDIPFYSEVDPVTLRSLFAASRRIRPDIINAHTSHTHTQAIFLNIVSDKFSIVVTRRVSFPVRKTIWNDWKYRNARIKRYIAISHAVKRRLTEIGVREKRIDVVYPGVPTSFNVDRYKTVEKSYSEVLRERLGLCKGDFIIGNISAFTKEKDHITMIKALREVLYRYENTKAVILGRGPLKSKLKTLVDRLQVKDRVKIEDLTGGVHDYFSLFDLFLVTSKEEGACSSIIDSMSSGVPVIATKAGGIPEIVEDKVNGLLCERGDWQGIADRISYIINNPSQRKRLIEKAKVRSMRFSIERMVNSTLKVYQEIL